MNLLLRSPFVFCELERIRALGADAVGHTDLRTLKTAV